MGTETIPPLDLEETVELLLEHYMPSQIIKTVQDRARAAMRKVLQAQRAEDTRRTLPKDKPKQQSKSLHAKDLPPTVEQEILKTLPPNAPPLLRQKIEKRQFSIQIRFKSCGKCPSCKAKILTHPVIVIRYATGKEFPFPKNLSLNLLLASKEPLSS